MGAAAQIFCIVDEGWLLHFDTVSERHCLCRPYLAIQLRCAQSAQPFILHPIAMLEIRRAV